MTTKEMALEVLKQHSCLTGFEIKGFIHRWYNVDVSPQSISGLLRPLVSKGYIGKCAGPNGKMAYWISDYGKEKMFK